MKTKALSLALVFLALCGVAQTAPKKGARTFTNEPRHLYRKVGDRYYDLTPLYKWLDAGRPRPRPMPEWRGYDHDEVVLVQYEVVEVIPPLLLVHQINFNPGRGESARPTFALTNYPAAGSVVDGKKISFFALKTGAYRYYDPSGAQRTIELWDYGTPYDPFKLAASLKRTNSVALTNSLTR